MFYCIHDAIPHTLNLRQKCRGVFDGSCGSTIRQSTQQLCVRPRHHWNVLFFHLHARNERWRHCGVYNWLWIYAGEVSVKTTVLKDGHLFVLHIVDPKDLAAEAEMNELIKTVNPPKHEEPVEKSDSDTPQNPDGMFRCRIMCSKQFSLRFFIDTSTVRVSQGDLKPHSALSAFALKHVVWVVVYVPL